MTATLTPGSVVELIDGIKVDTTDVTFKLGVASAEITLRQIETPEQLPSQYEGQLVTPFYALEANEWINTAEPDKAMGVRFPVPEGVNPNDLVMAHREINPDFNPVPVPGVDYDDIPENGELWSSFELYYDEEADEVIFSISSIPPADRAKGGFALALKVGKP